VAHNYDFYFQNNESTNIAGVMERYDKTFEVPQENFTSIEMSWANDHELIPGPLREMTFNKKRGNPV
jgi:hypothetical protein